MKNENPGETGRQTGKTWRGWGGAPVPSGISAVKVTWDYSSPIPQSQPGIWSSSARQNEHSRPHPIISLQLNSQLLSRKDGKDAGK